MAKGDHIDPIKVFYAAEWMCYICHDKIDPQVRWPDMLCATIEHIVPLSAGGEHRYENVTASHRKCNEARSRS